MLWDVADGNLVLHVTATANIGWTDLRVCAPYGGPTQPGLAASGGRSQAMTGVSRHPYHGDLNRR
ncbi:MAG: hypothetical protein ACRD0O_15545 [Acidimicrobiia bacterium]